MSSPSPRRSRPGLIALAWPRPSRREYRFDQIESLERRSLSRGLLILADNGNTGAWDHGSVDNLLGGGFHPGLTHGSVLDQ